MNKQEESPRYIFRVIVTIFTILNCVSFIFSLLLYTGIAYYFFGQLKATEELTASFLPKTTPIFALTWLIATILLSIMFIRSLWSNTETTYPHKLFGWLSAGILCCYIINIATLIIQIRSYTEEESYQMLLSLMIYALAISWNLSLVLPALQFWRPSPTKTWVFNGLAIVLYITGTFTAADAMLGLAS